jgi:hypothetical protein
MNAEDFMAPVEMEMPMGHLDAENHTGKPDVDKENIKVEAIEGGITIGELFANRSNYDAKKVMIRGKVVKTNYGIMGKNWIHIQDGTSFDGKYDLTITTLEEGIVINNVVTFEGIIALNKDFGHGYKYEIILEEGVKK